MNDWISACSGGDCPRARRVGGWVEVGESTRPSESTWFTPAEWGQLLLAVKAGKFDKLAETP
jgi:hypothetical protein